MLYTNYSTQILNINNIEVRKISTPDKTRSRRVLNLIKT